MVKLAKPQPEPARPGPSDPDFYRKIGAKGGRLGHTGGFASEDIGADGLDGRERARVAGMKGGRKSRRVGKVVDTPPETEFERSVRAQTERV